MVELVSELSGHRVYLMGPMTGYEDFNRPAFRRMTELLREQGVRVTSPDELDTTDPVSAASPEWADYLARDLRWLVLAEAGVALPGWEESRGARLEAAVLGALGRPVYETASGPTTNPLIQRVAVSRLPTVSFHRSDPLTNTPTGESA